MRPSLMVQRTLPCIVQPSKGVLCDFDAPSRGAIGPLRFGIEDDHVGKAADGQRAAAFEAEQRGGLRAQQAQNAAEGQLPLLVQPAQAEAERGFKAGDAVGRVLELDFLFVRGMRRVVGGDGVDNAVEDAFDHGVAVGGRAQRRIHLGIGVVEADVLFGEQEVMRRDFAGDAQSVAARLAHGGHSRGGGGVRDVQMRARVAQLGDQADVALDEAGLGFGRHAAQAELERQRARRSCWRPGSCACLRRAG